jgi:hypothetical protein
VSRPLAILSRLAVLGAFTLLPRAAHAYDAEVDAQTIGQAYQLKGVTGDPLLSRRRVTQSLQVGVYNLTEPTADGPQVSFKARMRIDGDFGMSSEEYTVRDANLARFVPLLQPAPVDLMYGYVEGRRFAKGWISFKVGRQYVVDPLGWYAFDGGLVRVTTPAYFAVETYAGWEARGGLPLSTDPQIGRWELGGVVRANRSDYAPSSFPSVQPQHLAPVWAVAIESTGPTWIHGRLTYRKAYNTGQAFVGGSGALLGPDEMGIYDRTRTSSERLGYALNVNVGDYAGLRGNLIYDLYGQQWNDIQAGTDLYIGKRVTASLDYQYFKPIFDADSIFNVFAIEPMDDLTARVDVEATERLSFSLDAMARRYRADEFDDKTGDANKFAVSSSIAPGGGVVARYRWSTARAVLRGSGLTGDQGTRVGADLSYDKTVLQRVLLDGRLSLWKFADKLRADANGTTRDATSFGYVLGAGYRFSPEANAMLQFEHDINRLVGMRYRLLAVLNVRVWL